MESLAAILPSLMKQMGLEETAKGWRALEWWPEVAGERIASHSRATSFRDGTLTVEVEGSAWMHELGFLKRELVRRLDQHAGGGVIRDVRLVLARGRSQR